MRWEKTDYLMSMNSGMHKELGTIIQFITQFSTSGYSLNTTGISPGQRRKKCIGCPFYPQCYSQRTCDSHMADYLSLPQTFVLASPFPWSSQINIKPILP
jgi:hypothetical protein